MQRDEEVWASGAAHESIGGAQQAQVREERREDRAPAVVRRTTLC